MNDRIKLVGLDLDGTVLGKDRVLTQRTIDALALAASKGVNLVIDSGRAFSVVPKEIRELPFMRYYVLCNGAEIYDKQRDETIYRAEIPLQKALKIYDDLTAYPEVYLDCYMSDGSWARAEDYLKIDSFVSDQSHRDVLHNTREPVPDFRDALVKRGKPVYKLQTIYMNTHIRNAEREKMEKLYPEMNITTSYPYNLEINALEATKGGGLLKLAEILGLERDQVIAFGDSENDLSMIQCAGTGYAMENAAPDIKLAADKIAPPNFEDGVAQVLEALFE